MRGARSSAGSALPNCADYASLRKRAASSSSWSPSEPGQGHVAGRAVKKVLRPAQRKTRVGRLVDRYRVGVRRACTVVKQSRSAFYYQPRDHDDAPLLGRIEEIAAVRVRYGFWRIYVLLRREGWKANHKRMYRLYCQAGLHLRRKRPRRRKAAAHRLERTVLTAPNQVWSMDFVADALFDGRRFRALTVVDNVTKESLAIELQSFPDALIDRRCPASRDCRPIRFPTQSRFSSSARA